MPELLLHARDTSLADHPDQDPGAAALASFHLKYMTLQGYPFYDQIIMAHFYDLPTEILTLIMNWLYRYEQELTYSERIPRLCKQTLLCRRWLPHAQALLFDEFQYLGPKESWRIRSFFRAISRNPNLASEVMKLDLADWQSGDEWPIFRPIPRDVPFLNRALRHLGLEQLGRERHINLRCTDELYLALLISSLPNLTSLRLPAIPMRSPLAEVLARISDMQYQRALNAPLGKLFMLAISRRQDYPHPYTIPLEHPTSLRGFHIEGAINSVATWPQIMQNITILQILFPVYDECARSVADLLDAFTNLEYFLYMEKEGGPMQRNPALIGQALRKRAETLLRLDIQARITQDTLFKGEDTLCHFKKLRYLRIDDTFFMKSLGDQGLSDSLPPSLIELDFRGSPPASDPVGFIKSLLRYVKAKEAMNLQLTELILGYEYVDNIFMRALMRVCAKHNVTFRSGAKSAR